jgi:hypothetical protein
MTIDQLPDDALRNRRVLVRVDYNVPIEGGRVTDDTRIRATLPTLGALRERGARLVLISHLGRPKGMWNEEYTLAPVAEALERQLGAPVGFVPRAAGAPPRPAGERGGAGGPTPPPPRPAGSLPLQTIAMIVFGGAAAVALLINQVVGAYMVAAGLLAHSGWDAYHHWTNRVVSRSLAEFCFVLDALLALAIVVVVLRS